MPFESTVPAIGLDNFWPYAAGYLYAVLVGGLLIRWTVGLMWQLVKIEVAVESPLHVLYSDSLLKRYVWQGDILGGTERALYVTSFLVARPEFLLVWLTVKTITIARRWTEDRRVKGRAIYNNFLVGNGLSILYAAAGAGIIYWSTLPEPNRSLDAAVMAGALLAAANLLVLLYFWYHRRSLFGRLRATVSPETYNKLYDRLNEKA